MADQLTGRALDEAAAIAMGVLCLDGIWRHQGGRDVRPPRLGSAVELIDEMLSWLHACGVCRPQYNRVDVSSTGHFCRAVLVRCCFDADDGTCDEVEWSVATAEGATLNEALARLVVEVARARGKQ